uniref:39S ribosomal protein L24, mitochondrial n=1 Tax=Parastrongyloides trichosuri TaxID=131310 RepID=A0A0N4ZG25_PARTI
MLRTVILRCPKKPSSELDFAKHIPKDYIERVKRTVPKKVYSNRLGAPDIIRWELPPEDYVPSASERPWAYKTLQKSLGRANKYNQSLFGPNFFRLRRNPYNKELPDDKVFIFRGDYVSVMVGRDKYKKGRVISVNRETNTVLVEGLHTKLGDEIDGHEKLGVPDMKRWQEQPLDYSKGEVMLINPADDGPTEVEWKLNDEKTEYIRVSKSTGHHIPLPAEAYVTYDYISPKNYIETVKDTKPSDVLKRTYEPKLCSFEDEIMASLGIKDDRKRKPTFWY